MLGNRVRTWLDSQKTLLDESENDLIQINELRQEEKQLSVHIEELQKKLEDISEY